MAPEWEGFLNVLKPPGMTSHDVVAYLRRTIAQKRIGHTGTLDPQAAGVLPVCLGRATRLSAMVTDQCKGYRAELTLGWSTDTQDAWGAPICTLPAEAVQERIGDTCIRAVLAEYIGTIQQQPPMVSAVRHKGRKLYEWARDGVEVERPSREVTIHSLEILRMDENTQGYPRVLLEIVCSKGTYVRTLCADVGERLGVGGHMSYLLRTRSGPFDLAEAITLEEATEAFQKETFNSLLKPLDYVLQALSLLVVDQDLAQRFQHGQPLADPEELWAEGELVRVYAPGNIFIGLGQKLKAQIWPQKVFHEE